MSAPDHDPGAAHPRAPLLLIAIGNASRGDDALGPALAQALHDHPARRSGQLEILSVYQLQIEHALALEGRRAVLLADASHEPLHAAATLHPLHPAASANTPFTHALPPGALLALARRVLHTPPPPVWLLALQGSHFELGSALSETGQHALQHGQVLAEQWLELRLMGHFAVG
ncbi:MAG: hydrogenase maturation protease [Rubrivivax sp.]|nr:hydrogenase maturation protease [Rubrivivax sp.]